MNYNLDFLIAGLIILIFVLYHFAVQNCLVDTNSKVFKGFMIVGLLDITFDIISSALINMADPQMHSMILCSLTIFYLMQVYLPCGMFLYVRSLWTDKEIKNNINIIGLLTFTGIMSLMVLFNYWNGYIFRVNGAAYEEGTCYLLVYVHAIFYLLITLHCSYRKRAELGKYRLFAICESIAILIVCVVIQMVWQNPLLIGYGIALSISVFFFTVNNPKEYTDNMTGVYDNRYFSAVVQSYLERKKYFHVITVDFHVLRKINAIYGSLMGNQIICEIAKKLHALSKNGQVYRIYGNRFALIADSYSEYETLLCQLEQTFRQKLELSGMQFPAFSVICGIENVSVFEKSDTLLAYMEYLAESALADGDVVLIRDNEKMQNSFAYRNAMESYLITAIEQDLFEVVYQPIYSMKTGTFQALEALSRLKHPDFGPVPPDVFITIAERHGQIAQLGYLQFLRICRFLKANPEVMQRFHNIKINLSPAELITKGHCERLINTIQEYGFPCSWFQFEITETVATEYSSSLFEIAKKFADAGIGLCLDDFGSGFANLNTVLKLPFCWIKLDRSLLAGIGKEQKSTVFYKNIVSVLQSMGYRVISEGVETKEEVELLVQWGVDMIQGYYFSKPKGELEILDIVHQQKSDYNEQKCISSDRK